ncbi:hypothetical protein PGTUg99_036469 [Puccinia graminis f. sp. tritici]|uniref:CBM1 domain-containing protein n=1 Tax=Puccinia graminis f. sp. tritici TaxID=56615 RepID=A0A5B0QW66_PUCGR|nr:hypothetical protein PGTUg99_036469 [Puccinia graminis f. sp. tritici]
MYNLKLAITLMAMVLAPMSVIATVYTCPARGRYRAQACYSYDSNYGTFNPIEVVVPGVSFACPSSEAGFCCASQPGNYTGDCTRVQKWISGHCAQAN